MTRVRVLTLATAALLLEVAPLVAAHGDKHEAHDAPPAPAPVEDNGAPQSYWGLSEYASLMYWHIALEIIAWIVILPVGVMLSIARSRLALLSQFLFLAINAIALVLGVVYNHQTPELYENNAHSKIGWIITWIASAWVVMAVVETYASRMKMGSLARRIGDDLNAANMAQYQRAHGLPSPPLPRWSNDSGQGTERNSSSLYDNSRSPSVESEQERFLNAARGYPQDDDEYYGEDEKHDLLKNTAVDRFFSRNIVRFAGDKSLRILRFLYVVIERTILVHGFTAVASGTIVYGGIARGGAVFNILAHYVKGGIFFGYGLLTLGRWMGAFADFGWAWNVKPPQEVVGRRRAALPSAEFTESFVIFLYGCTNVFLEHLAAWGGAWTVQDLEHVSISVMFFGGGLLGMIVESTKMRDFLNTPVVSAQPPTTPFDDKVWQPPKQYRLSMNPMPGLIILLLGKMMSSHHQSSMLSTMIHGQWGTMFMGFALARALTYMTLYVKPPTSYLPSRPPTEVITSFCLIAGGITFMVSNKDTVAVLESYDLDAMFTFTITMGLVALLMSWTVIVVAIKGWAVQKASANPLAKSNAGVLA